MSMHAAWMTHRSMTADPSVKQQKLKAGTVKRIFTFAKPYRLSIWIFLFTVVVDAALIVATPLLLRQLIDKGVIPKDGALVTRLAIYVGLLAVADAAMSMLGRYFSSRIGEGLIYDLRSLVFGHVQRQSIAFFTRTQTGALISRINSDVMGAQQAFTATLSGLVSNVVSLVLVGLTMLILSWQITIFSLLLLPVFLIPTKWVGRKLQELTRDSFNTNAEMSSTMTERFNVSGAMLVALYGEPSREREYFRSRARKVADIGIKMAMLNRLFFIALTSVAAIATAFAYGIGGHLAINGGVTVGTLLAVTALLARLYGPLTALSNVRIDVMTSLVSFERVFEVLDLEPMVKNRENAIELKPTHPKIEFKNVSFSYPRAEEISLASLESAAKPETIQSGEVLRGLSFTAAPGTLTALVGPSGAGKTTISALLPRLYDVTTGAIEIDGHDIRDLTLESLRGAIGVVMQDAHLFHETIAENLRYAKSDATEDEMRVACESAQIWELIKSLPNGLDTMVGERGHRLSGGEKQRLAIARLLLKSPSVVILDEATAHLDSENEALVQAALQSALKGRTSIVIAHRLSTVRDADQILVLEKGQIVERGTHDELVASGGLYADLYNRQDLTGAAN
ncbi:MAG: ABC transporter ATP-binding protein [Actinobacteria bacterium]|jgi:ATP-binding cassette subfamily B protein|nr:ABC transporter ATP-binding protein [Actinomycetota bacterium]NCX38124.1 ABC transporter ATP-binding protein [Actinomycetota bacterium]NDE40010.1 ABC transporter ATP-binding protein [Actinomycetota bacterium]NDF89509.1 ABC transporter ATP-binding protein [Actinomycetota bacterium]